jgi:transcription antitermination factor NusG
MGRVLDWNSDARGCPVPILAAEPDRYPVHLFETPDAIDASDRDWFVLHTRPRQEKSLARYLHAAGVSYFLPAIPRRRRLPTRVLTTHMPLFPGYLFLFADRDERQTALASNRVAHAIEVRDQVRLWDDLRQVNKLIGADVPVTAESQLAPGTPVEITTGPLAGLRGTVIKTASGRRFVVRVDFIHQGASVLLEDCSLLPLRRAGAAVS